MIYIVTLNPSIDYLMHSEVFEWGKTNRSTREEAYIGGKGVNVAIVLNNLGIDSSVLGFVAGFTGRHIQEEIQKYRHIRSDFNLVSGLTRINVKLKGETETEINGSGTEVSGEDVKALFQKLNYLNPDDLVILTGRVAKGMKDDWYIEVARMLYEKGIPFIVDIGNETMLKILPYKPLLIKPNKSELEAMFGVRDLQFSDIVAYGRKLVALGAQHCIVSMGKDGSVLITKDRILTASVPDGELVNSVGAGDSMVAGFISAWQQKQDLEEIYRMAVSCGTATAYSQHLSPRKMVYRLMEGIIVREIKEE